jgi:hypothetical protein
MHWDGSVWTYIPTPDPYPSGGSNPLLDVGITPDGGIWAVGYTAPNYSEFYTFTLYNWQRVASPDPPSHNSVLTTVAIVSSNDLWALGHYLNNSTSRYETFTLHWDGSQWNVVPSPSPSDNTVIYGGDAIASNDVWAVGFTIGSPDQTVIMHYAGDPCASASPTVTSTQTPAETATATSVPPTPCTITF